MLDEACISLEISWIGFCNSSHSRQSEPILSISSPTVTDPFTALANSESKSCQILCTQMSRIGCMDARGCREAGEQLKYSYHQKQCYKKLTLYSTTPSNVRSMYCNSVSHSAKTACCIRAMSSPCHKNEPSHCQCIQTYR